MCVCSVYAVISSPHCGGGQVEQSELKLRKSPEQIQQSAEHQIKIPYRKGGGGEEEAFNISIILSKILTLFTRLVERLCLPQMQVAR